MIYFDTNILVYNSIEQDFDKTVLSEKLINQAIKNSEFVISSLVLNEFIFTLSKLKIIDECKDKISLYSKFCKFNFNKTNILNAYQKCRKDKKCKNINDFIHLEIANKHCKKIVTFDSDFKNLQKFYDLKIELLGKNHA